MENKYLIEEVQEKEEVFAKIPPSMIKCLTGRKQKLIGDCEQKQKKRRIAEAMVQQLLSISACELLETLKVITPLEDNNAHVEMDEVLTHKWLKVKDQNFISDKTYFELST